ncbi:hypothetical protein MACJ_003964 [Theileria orientalis]|uniref:Uncharacterized protein n=1 Tax=Theileria orientalis TaxID=68886 RepID=A0A976SKW1_THEOR|nr:hypothetical protein MACJ_003964 [Theileria orientalis]
MRHALGTCELKSSGLLLELPLPLPLPLPTCRNLSCSKLL